MAQKTRITKKWLFLSLLIFTVLLSFKVYELQKEEYLDIVDRMRTEDDTQWKLLKLSLPDEFMRHGNDRQWEFSEPPLPETRDPIFTKYVKMFSENKTWHGKSLILPRDDSQSLFTIDKDIAHVRKMLQLGGLDIISLSKYPLEAYMEDWEWDLLNTTALDDAMDAGNGTTSSITIVNRKSSYRLGDLITVRIDIKDGNGKQKNQGGDQVRVWISDVQHRAVQASDVLDMGNGSYISDIPLSWAGNISIKASLKYNAEVQRAHFFLRNFLKTTKFMAAGFMSPNGSEATLCSPFPVIPSFHQLCNFTNENGGLPWFCGKPRNFGLNCRHWMKNFDLPFTSPLPLTAAERKWTEWSQLKKYETIPYITVHVYPKNEFFHQRPKPRCGNLPLKASWFDIAPRGFFINKVWHPLNCTLQSLSRTALTQCLRNRTFLFLGDSNGRYLYDTLIERFKCQNTAKGKAQSPYYCSNKLTNTHINYFPHGLPLHVGFRTIYPDRFDLQHVNRYIDEIPSQGNFIVLIHYYFHLTPYHYSVFTARIRAVRKSVENLLKRNARTKIIFRGPHAACHYKEWHGVLGSDIVGPHFTKIIKREFEGLYGNVFFLNPWDMTVAVENVDVHPDQFVNEAMMNIILDFACIE